MKKFIGAYFMLVIACVLSLMPTAHAADAVSAGNMLASLVTFVKTNEVVLLASAWAISELLSLIPAVKSNGLFQLVYNFLKNKRGQTALK